ncbi:MAG TPA: valine--tRNA ligase [Chthoniobacterales bacterium]|jgi:valyl-tRNA synthetase|nr:valine--tRNA ligase [Chthoniobacterales bacterium]
MPELSKTYDPNAVEPKWYAAWEEAGYFRADAHSPKPPYSIVIPPPNVTGILTLGHVLNNTIQDILARRARMQGFEVLWLPGTDHAGVGTQTAVEKNLRKTENKTRQELGREEFIRRVVEWTEKHGGIIIKQLKRLGASCDWSRQRYTFDDDYVRAVENVFVDLYRKGFVYRGRRMINWDPAAQTALSDEEVIARPQKGKLYYVRYELVDETTPARTALTIAGSPPPRFIEVATTRPETIMADTAVAVHPDDPRYLALIGMQVWRPLAREKLPIIGDAAIDPKFGTGVLKVTPAHDTLDFEIGVRHSLPVIDVLHPDGRINCPAVPELDGVERFAARQKAAELLAQADLLTKEEPHENNVGFSQRSEVPIEPRLSEQWFLRYPKTKEALDVVRDHLIRFFPRHWEKVYAQWLENIQDWCISRQIWWGHRIPAWYRKSQNPNPKSQGGEDIYVGIEPPPDPEKWRQDEDTLDTWFSSWLWAYETMDEETRRKFYPTSALVTGPDIIFFWVARMIIAGLEFKPGNSEKIQDNIPFRDVFLTGLIRDKQGRKMSKSLGNSPDPLDLIGKYGADGLRFGLMRIAPSGQDIAFDEKQIEEGRNFATKLWNAARFRQMHGPSDANPQIDPQTLSIYSVEVLSRFNELLVTVENAYREYKFNEVAQGLYDFFWGDYCDWFVEAAKTDIFAEDEVQKKSVLAVMDFVLSGFLRLLHPFMPHITEELWSVFGFGSETIQFQPLPNPVEVDPSGVEKVRAVYDVVRAGRNLRAESKVPSNKKTSFVLRPSGPINEREVPTMSRLLNAEELKLDPKFQAEAGVPVAVTPLGELFLIIATADKAAERERLDKEIARLDGELRTVNAKLSNASFVERAPAAVVEEHRKRKTDFSEQLSQLRQARAAMD